MKKIDSLDISDVEFCIFFEGMFTMCNMHGSYFLPPTKRCKDKFLLPYVNSKQRRSARV